MWTRLRPVYSYHLSMVDISRHYDKYVWFHDSRLFSPDNALLLLFRSAVSIPLKKKQNNEIMPIVGHTFVYVNKV